MTVLLIDSGNTRSKCAFLQSGEQQAALTRIKSVLNEDLTEYLDNSARDRATSLLMSSVADKAIALSVTEWARHHHMPLKRVTTPRYGFGVVNGYEENFRNLGVDRWLAMIAARQSYKGPQLIADLGTAITLDLLDEFGQHHGGWIMPGYELLQRSIAERAPGVFSAQQTLLDEQPMHFARNTDIALQQGAQATLVGLLNQAQVVAQKHLKTALPLHMIVTGGGAQQLRSHLPPWCAVDEKLVLKGLALYAQPEASGIC